MHKDPTANLTDCQQRWLNHVRRAIQLGSFSAYAREQHVAVEGLYRWRTWCIQRGIEVGQKSSTVVPVRLLDAPRRESSEYRVHFPGGAVLEGAFDREQLSDLIFALNAHA